MEQTISHSTGPGIEELFKAAFKRTKERFLTYFLTYILSLFIFLGAFLAIGLVAGLNVLIWVMVKSSVLTGVVGFLSTVAGIGTLIFAGCWTSLAYLYALVSPQKTGVMEVYKHVKPLVWPYFKVSVITALFMIGLIPFGIITIGIVLVLWAIWGMFMIFVFLEKKETGLKNLFISKEIVKSNFWAIVLRALMMYGAYMVIIILLGSVSGNENSGGIGAVLISLAGLFAGPFITSYFYELYKHLPHPKETGTNTFWIVLSIIGWVISIALVIGLFATIVHGVGELLENREVQENLKMLEQNPQDLLDESEQEDLERIFEEMQNEFETGQVRES